MIVTSSGQVLTNNHVIEGATSILVTISGYGTRRATVVGADPSDDVALLQVSGVSGLPTVELADSSNLTVDQPVVAMGNALGQGGAPTVTEGTITGLERSITVGDGRGGTSDLSGLIQTDARIQPGDSGGPLVNADGQVVGMITAGSRTTRFTQGSSVGYAIPSEDALVVVNQIRAGRASSTIFIGARGYLGVGVQDLDATTASELGLEVGAGVLVTGISPGMPADRAGLTQDSVITAINGQHVSSSDELGAAIRSHRPGERIRVTWIDSNRRIHTATVQLATGPAI